MSIVHSKPTELTRVGKLRDQDVSHSRLVNLLSGRFTRAERVKAMADNMLKVKYGTSGSSNRLFKRKN